MEYGPLGADEVELAADLYFQAFPERATMVSTKPWRVVAFGRDWFELMRRACGPSFMAARRDGQLAGFLLLLFPGTRLGPALTRGGFGFRLAVRALLGRYGFSSGAFRRIFRRLAGATGTGWPREVRSLPHVEAVLVRPECAGLGIGSALLSRAREMSEPMYKALSLLVEVENSKAIHLYERVGFRVVDTRDQRHLMVWDFSSPGAPEAATDTTFQAGPAVTR
jgi:ribosomal protein S18 acetylase RimI-like enzyme